MKIHAFCVGAPSLCQFLFIVPLVGPGLPVLITVTMRPVACCGPYSWCFLCFLVHRPCVNVHYFSWFWWWLSVSVAVHLFCISGSRDTYFFDFCCSFLMPLSGQWSWWFLCWGYQWCWLCLCRRWWRHLVVSDWRRSGICSGATPWSRLFCWRKILSSNPLIKLLSFQASVRLRTF